MNFKRMPMGQLHKIPKMIEIYDDYKDQFSEKAIADMERRKSVNQLLQYNHPIAPLKKGYDPYPEGLSGAIFNPIKKEDYDKQLYRTFCRLGVEFEYERRIAPVKCFGITVKRHQDIGEGVKVVIDYINNLANNSNYIKGSFVSLAYMPMAKDWNDTSIGSYAIFSYIAIDIDFHNPHTYKTFNKIDIQFEEGAIPKDLETINVIKNM